MMANIRDMMYSTGEADYKSAMNRVQELLEAGDLDGMAGSFEYFERRFPPQPDKGKIRAAYKNGLKDLLTKEFSLTDKEAEIIWVNAWEEEYEKGALSVVSRFASIVEIASQLKEVWSKEKASDNEKAEEDIDTPEL